MGKTKNAYDHLDDVLYSLCRHGCDIMSGWIPYPSTAIASKLGISVYATRKCLRKLVEKGLADRDSVVPASKEYFLPLNGFCITDEARKTDAYRRASREEAELCAKCFGGTVEEYLRAFT